MTNKAKRPEFISDELKIQFGKETPNPTPCPNVKICKETTNLLVLLLRGEVPNKKLRQLQCKTWSYKDASFADFQTVLSTQGYSLRLEVFPSGIDDEKFDKLTETIYLDLSRSEKISNSPLLKIQTKNYDIEARVLTSASRSTKIRVKEKLIGECLSISAVEWTAMPRTGRIPRFWVGTCRLFGEQHPANLIVAEKGWRSGLGKFSQSAYHFRGVYDYFIVDKRYILIDAHDKEIDREALRLDTLILCFISGHYINLSNLVGLDNAGNPLGIIQGFYHGQQEESYAESPVPSGRYVLAKHKEPQVWGLPFFEKLSQHINQVGKHELVKILCSYLDALTGDIEVAYLRLQVALEALAFYILEKNGNESSVLVKNLEEWRSWVSSSEVSKTIRGFAKEYEDKERSAKVSNQLHGKVLSAAEHASSGRVRDAFGEYQIKLDKAMKAEILLRDNIVHMLRMSKDGCDVERDVPRRDLVKRLLVALICCVVDYRGDFDGHALGPHGKPWWVIDEQCLGMARTRFVAAQED